MIGATGIWSEEEQSAHIFSYRLARRLSYMFQKDRWVFDFGCGKGTYSEYLSDVGFEYVWAIDGYFDREVDFPMTTADLTIYNEFTYGNEIAKGNVLCLEVFEHIPKQYESVFVDNIVRHCDNKLIISVAHEGQQGLGHVNCRPDWYVKELFEGKGFRYEKELTESIREQPEGYVAYLKENLFVFTKL